MAWQPILSVSAARTTGWKPITTVKDAQQALAYKPITIPTQTPFDSTAGGVALNTITGLPKAALDTTVDVGKSFYDMFAHPSADQRSLEAQLGSQTNPVTKYVVAPTFKIVSRFLSPMFQPFANDVADIHEVSRPGGIADSVAQGKLPPSILDEFAALQKTAPQIVGDVAQAVLATGAGSLFAGAAERTAGSTALDAIKYGTAEGVKFGTAFGAAQAASSGSTDPVDLASILARNIGVAGLFGAITSGAIPVAKKFLPQIKEAEALYHGANTDTANSIRENGFQGSKDFPGNGMVSLTPDPAEAGQYAHLNGTTGEVLKVRINGDNIKTYSSMEEYLKAVDAHPDLSGGAAEQAINAPYDAVHIKVPGQPDVVFANPDAITIDDPNQFGPVVTRGAPIKEKAVEAPKVETQVHTDGTQPYDAAGKPNVFIKPEEPVATEGAPVETKSSSIPPEVQAQLDEIIARLPQDAPKSADFIRPQEFASALEQFGRETKNTKVQDLATQYGDLVNKATVDNANAQPVGTFAIKSAPLVKEKKGSLAIATAEIKGQKVNTPDQVVSKTSFKSLISSLPDRKADFTINEVDGQKRMELKTPNGQMSIRPSALGLVDTNLPVGSRVTVSAEDLLPKGTAFRVSNDKGVVLAAGFNPKFDVFLENDLKPAFKSAKTGVAAVWDFIKKIVSPASRSLEAGQTAAILREGLARMTRRKEIVYKALQKSRSVFDTYTKDESLAFIDNLETGKANPGAEQFTTVMRDALDTRWKTIQEIKGSEAYIANYFPHIWKDPEVASQVLTGFGKRPLEGSKGYMKQRTIPTIKEGVALGLEPSSYNPVDLVMARISDMDRFLMAHDIWTQFKEQGLRKFVKPSGEVPAGWIKIDDKIATSFQFSPEEKALVLRGSWYMPEKAATIVNNYLSPGLTRNPIYNGFRMIGNSLNQIQLGLSGYHAFFTSGDAVISKAALEIQKVFGKSTTVSGRVASAAKVVASPVTAPYYLWRNIDRGNKLLTDYFSKNPEVPMLVDALERAGGRVKMDSFYLNDAVGSFLKAVRSENYIGALIRAPGAAIEVTAKPIMQYLVPRQKLGVFADGAKTILEQGQKEGWSEYKTTLRLQEMWDSVDNRMGQLVYDNLFWHKVTKDLAMVATRSVGWNLGTFRELGGGIAQFAELPLKAATKAGRANIRMSPKMAYTLALPYVVGMWGAMTFYLYNQKAPETLLDYFYPRTGKVKPDGTEERISLPSYMKDVFAYKSEGLQTVANKLHPELATIIAMMQNKDYYGTEIRNPDDPIVKQFQDLATYQASQYVPFSITNLIQRNKTGGGWLDYLQSFAGITPAPGYITRAPMQTEIQNLYDKRFGGGVQSKEQTDIAKQKAEVRSLYLTGKADEANKQLDTLVSLGIVKNRAQFIREADIPNDVKLFTQLPSSDQINLLKKMELYQMNRYAWTVHSDVKAQFYTISNNAKSFADMVKSGEIKAPIWKQGQDISQKEQ